MMSFTNHKLSVSYEQHINSISSTSVKYQLTNHFARDICITHPHENVTFSNYNPKKNLCELDSVEVVTLT